MVMAVAFLRWNFLLFLGLKTIKISSGQISRTALLGSLAASRLREDAR